MSWGPWQLARARHTAATVGVLVVLGILEYALGDASVHLFGQDVSLSVPWAVLVPAVTAAVIGVRVHSATADLEGGTARSLPALRAGHLLVVLTVGLLTTAAGSAHLQSAPITGPAAVRNYVGLTGLALMSAAVLGSSLAWPAPVAFALAAATVGADHGAARTWALPIHPDKDSYALLAAVVTLGVGAALIALRGPRDSRTEQD